jgi:hypothetical protein
MLVVVREPVLKRADQLKGAGPLLQPEALFLEGPDEPFRVCITLRVMLTGECLMDLQGRTGLHKGHRGRLTPVVTHQRHALPRVCGV